MLHAVKNITIIFVLFFVSGCGFIPIPRSTEESIIQLENKLESFIGKKPRDVINTYGKPTKYKNITDIPGTVNGTYMIYDYRPYNNDCVIMFKFEKETLRISDWDYEGNCLLFDGM